jgi:DNA-binding PadR family transcriptional regulator
MSRSKPPALGEFEQLVILAILRLEDNAYGVTILQTIHDCTDRDPAPGALYNTLDRLEEKGLLTSRAGDPTPARGGRSKRFFSVTPSGIEAVARAQRAYQKLLANVTLPVANA